MQDNVRPKLFAPPLTFLPIFSRIVQKLYATRTRHKLRLIVDVLFADRSRDRDCSSNSSGPTAALGTTRQNAVGTRCRPGDISVVCVSRSSACYRSISSCPKRNWTSYWPLSAGQCDARTTCNTGSERRVTLSRRVPLSGEIRAPLTDVS